MYWFQLVSTYYIGTSCKTVVSLMWGNSEEDEVFNFGKPTVNLMLCATEGASVQIGYNWKLET